ncbi:MAG: DNA polymerase IV [Candidatus Competibacteraceae bacterium]
MTPPRKIIHLDMDAFYAAVEQRDFPDYRGQPVIVGGDPEYRGVVATCSYEARRFGVRSAMSAARARQLCPQAIFVRPRFAVYRQISQTLQAIFRRYTHLIEPVALDEAYLDVTGVTAFQGSATRLAQEIKRAIQEETQLTASAGVSYNKFLAKLASDLNKPDGLYLITPEAGPAFVESLPIERFHGVGPATAARMKALGIHTGRDLQAWSEARLRQVFGKLGRYYYLLARGIDERPVISQRVRLSLGAETTFPQDLDDLTVLQQHLLELASEVVAALAEHQRVGYTLTVKVKYANFEQVTRRQTVTSPLRTVAELQPLLPVLLARTEAGQRPVRLLGVIVSNLEEASVAPQGALDL